MATTHAIVSQSSVQLTFSAKPVQMVLTNTPTFNVCTYPLSHVDVAKNASSRALFRRVVRVALAWLALCSVSFGQIKLTQEVTQSWVGFQNPKIVDGVIVAGVNSKPTLSSTSTTIKVETAVPYKFSQVKAVRLPSLERITLEQIDDGYRFKPSAPAGLYAIEYLAFDPEKGIASEEITVELKPIEPVKPIVPDDMPQLSAEARKVVVELVQGMAKDIEAVNADIDAGRVKTVMESAAATVQRDIATRNKFKADMNKLLEPRLGNAGLPTTAKQTFKEIADGWRTVK